LQGKALTKILEGGFLMQKIKISELACQVTKKMEAAGYSSTTIWRMYSYALIPLVRQHEAQGVEYLDMDIVIEYRQRIFMRQVSGTINRKHSSRLLDGVDKLTRFNDTGKLEWSCPSKISKYKLNKFYEFLLSEYTASFDIYPSLWPGKSTS